MRSITLVIFLYLRACEGQDDGSISSFLADQDFTLLGVFHFSSSPSSNDPEAAATGTDPSYVLPDPPVAVPSPQMHFYHFGQAPPELFWYTNYLKPVINNPYNSQSSFVTTSDAPNIKSLSPCQRLMQEFVSQNDAYSKLRLENIPRETYSLLPINYL